jgi:hypothetical protein
MIYEVCSILLRDAPDRTDFLVVKQDTIELISSLQHLRPEGCRDKLSCRRKFMYHRCKSNMKEKYCMSEMDFVLLGNLLTCNGCPVLSVEIRVNLVEEIEWCGVTFLNSKD